jgi:isochorismate pyruvate lyase
MSEVLKPVPADPIKAPKECHSMGEVRAGVDDVDRQLVKLLARRQGYMEAAARIKPSADEVVVPWRVTQVIENAVAEGAKNGLSSRIAEPLWRVLVEKCIEHEAKTWDELHKKR